MKSDTGAGLGSRFDTWLLSFIVNYLTKMSDMIPEEYRGESVSIRLSYILTFESGSIPQQWIRSFYMSPEENSSSPFTQDDEIRGEDNCRAVFNMRILSHLNKLNS